MQGDQGPRILYITVDLFKSISLTAANINFNLKKQSSKKL